MHKIQNDYTLKQNPLRLLDPAVLVIAILPWLLLIAHQNWPLPGLDFDSLFSWGLYKVYNLKIPLTTIDSSHYYSRLGAIFPGYAIFQLLPTLRATYALNFCYWYTVVFSIYYCLKLTVNKQAALLIAILMGSYPWMLSDFSSGFTDGPGICYLALTLVFLTCAAKKKPWQIFLVMGGMSFAGAIHSNFFVLNFIPVYVAYYFIINSDSRNNPVVSSLFFMSLGVIILTFIFGLINFYHGGQLLFFLSSIKAAINYNQRPPSMNPSNYPVYVTILSNRHLVLPLLVFASGVLFLWFNRLKILNETKRSALLIQLLYIFTAIVYLSFEVRGNISFLWSAQYAGFMIPILFLALGLQFNFYMDRKLYWRLISMGILFILLVRIINNFFLLDKKIVFSLFENANPFYGIDYSGLNLIMILLGIVVLIIFHIFQHKWPMHVLAVLIIFTSVFYSYMPNTVGARLTKDQFLAVDKGMRIIFNTKEYISQHRQRFWIDTSSFLTPVYKVLSGILGGYYDFFKWPNTSFKEMGDTFKLQSIDINGGRPKSGGILLILTDEPDVMFHAQKGLNLIGLTAQLIKVEKIEQGNLRFFMTFIKIIDKEESSYILRSSFHSHTPQNCCE